MKKLFTVHNTEKWLNILICKELLKINKKKINDLIEKWA